MSDAYLGEIRTFAFGTVPNGWRKCDGSLLPVNTNQALYSLLGNRFGGTYPTNFALPDLRGRVPVHPQPSQPDANEIGEKGGAEAVALTLSTMAAHNHIYAATTVNGTANGPGLNSNRVLATNSVAPPSGEAVYAAAGGAAVVLGPDACTPTGGGAAHNNVQPSLAVNFCICTSGYYPPRN
jgi:microcystin-dependent protein